MDPTHFYVIREERSRVTVNKRPVAMREDDPSYGGDHGRQRHTTTDHKINVHTYQRRPFPTQVHYHQPTAPLLYHPGGHYDQQEEASIL